MAAGQLIRRRFGSIDELLLGIKGTGWFFSHLHELSSRKLNACINHDKASLDILWPREESLKESDNLLEPDILAQAIVDDLQAALEQFRKIAMDWGCEGVAPKES